ncbi:MAG: biotin--[acetyl-CoA-carboxylase] ligase [Granulosicoccus sp.]
MNKPDTAVIAQALQHQGWSEVELHLFCELPSTSAWLWQHAQIPADESKVNSHPVLCATDWQTAGSGRRGKTWQSNVGNITFSLMTEIPHAPAKLMGLSLVTGIAIAEHLRSATGITVELKWPNDILFGGAKLGGLLTELKVISQPASPGSSASTLQSATRIVTGIGLNLLHSDALSNLGIGGTSLERAGAQFVERDVMIGGLAVSVLEAHERFHTQGWAVFEDAWRRYDCLAGKMVSVINSNDVEQVMAVGVGENGALMVRKGKRTYPVYSGDVSIRPVG